MRRAVILICLWPSIATPVAAQTVDLPVVPSIRSLFSGIVDDVARLGSASNLEILGAGGVLALAVTPVDVDLTRRAVASRAEEALDGGELIGGDVIQLAGALAAYAIGRAADSPRTATIGAELIRAQILSGGVTQGLKFAVRRRRPDLGRYSFPSGHASSSFATATIIAREFGWKAGVAAYGTATYVAVSRLSENHHFASDVIFGAAVGIASARAVRMGHGGVGLAFAPFFARDRRGVDVSLLTR